MWARVVFAAAGLASGLLLAPKATPWALGAAGAYLLFSLLVPFRKHRGGPFALLVLFADVVYFLVLVGAGIGSVIWLPAFFYLPADGGSGIRLSRARGFGGGGGERGLLRRRAIGGRYSPSGAPRWSMGTLAYAFAVYKKRLESRMEELERETRRDQGGSPAGAGGRTAADRLRFS